MINFINISKTYRTGTDWQKLLIRFRRDVGNTTSTSVQALNSVSFNVDDGEIVGLIGPNGAGKTTAAKIISGILIPNDGVVTVDDQNPADLSEAFKKSFALYRGEIKMLDDGVVVKDSLEARLEMYGVEKYDDNSFVRDIVKKLSAQHLLNKLPEELSQGQRTIVEFITAIAHNPTTMILDEPTNGLDIVAVQKFMEVLRSLKKTFSTTIIITSHNLHNVVAIADRIILINSGEVVLKGTTDEILKKESGIREIHVELEADFQVKEGFVERLGFECNINGPRVTATVDKRNIKDALATLLNELPVTDLKIVEPPIEEIFSKYFQIDE